MNPQSPASRTATELAWIEGEIGPAREAKVPLWDRGFMFAEAAYEVCIGRGGRIFAWNEHRRRLERTLAGIEIPEVAATARARRPGVPRARRRVRIRDVPALPARHRRRRAAAPRPATRPRARRLRHDPPARPVEPRPRAGERASRRSSRPDLRWQGATWKTTQLLPNVLAKKQSRAEGADDVIFVAGDGVVLEGAATNVFWVDGGRVRTAPLSRNILPGITRELLKTRLDVPFEEVEAKLETVKRASEVFMTGTTRDVTAVVKLDGATIGDGRPGPVARDLGRRFAELFERDCPAG